MRTLQALSCFALTLFAALFLCAGRVHATDISGTITSTLFIFDDSQLVGDVNCAVPIVLPGSNPCISFGADHIKLSLNGHTITGPVTPPTGCSLRTDSMYGVGIEATDRSNVKIEGPGIIQHFQRWGILIGLTGHPSSHVTVRKVTVYSNCWSGMQTFDTSESNFEENVWVNNAAGSDSAACGGICLVDSNNNVMHKSSFYGNGSLDYPTRGNLNFGIGFEGSSSENRVEQNDISGNTNGVFFFNTSSNNLIRRNIIVGNPPAQVIKTFTASNQQGADIAFRPNFTGTNNTIENNFCLTYIQGAGPATAPCPNINTKGVKQAANRAASPLSSQNASNDNKPTLKGPIASVIASAMSLTLLACGVVGGLARQRRRGRHAGRS